MAISVPDGAFLAAVADAELAVAPAGGALLGCWLAAEGTVPDLDDGDADVGDAHLVLAAHDEDCVACVDHGDRLTSGRIDDDKVEGMLGLDERGGMLVHLVVRNYPAVAKLWELPAQIEDA